MKDRVGSVVLNPVFLIVPILAVMVYGWQRYSFANLNLSVAGAGSNLFANGSFRQFGTDGVPAGWTLTSSGDADYAVGHSGGYINGNNFKIVISHITRGDISLSGPKIAIAPGKTYLFKGYYNYQSGDTFLLLARYFYKDGSSRLIQLQEYRNGSGTWSTVSDAFNGGDITGVQYVYRLAAPGTLELNNLYLEPKQNVSFDPPPTDKANLIPNSGLSESTDFNMPDGWTTYQSGSNNAAFAYEDPGGGRDLRVTLSDYKNGEAKWQYAPQPVTAHHAYDFSAEYESDAPVQAVAEYDMADGSRQIQPISRLLPADSWTSVHFPTEAPPNVKAGFVALTLNHDGTLATRHYSLTDVTKTGTLTWKRPIVSITFDDGWQSPYDNALPVLNRYRYKATYYINASTIQTPGFLTAPELNNLNVDGNEIASHGYAHSDMTAINDSQLHYQLAQGRDYLRQAGFNVQDMATPYGNSDPEVQYYARSYYQTLRSTDDGINTRQSFDPYHLKVLYVDADTGTKAVADAIKSARQNNGWLILVYHKVGSVQRPIKSIKVEDTSTDMSAFKGQINAVHESGLPVLTVAQAYKEVSQQ